MSAGSLEVGAGLFVQNSCEVTPASLLIETGGGR